MYVVTLTFNIVILKYPKHTDTTNFIEQMFSIGFLPIINKPTRISLTCATLIGDIWSNDLQNIEHSNSGVLFNDICQITFQFIGLVKQITQLIRVLCRIKGKKKAEHFVNLFNNLLPTDWDQALKIK